MNIRRARNGDEERLYQIQAEAIRHSGKSHYTSEQIEAWSGGLTPDESHARAIEGFARSIEEGLLIVAEDCDGKIVGFASLHIQTGEVSAVYVDPECTRRGIGRQLMMVIEEEARQLGIANLHLKASLNAVAFYESVGFAVDEQTIHRFRTGIEMPCAVMKKTLE